ncbi:MAG: hypothetical protein WD990_13530 [Acidimicrobiia bacterium]
MTTRVRGTETDLGPVRERFGGIDTPAALGGLFALIGALAFLSAIIAAGAGALAFQMNAIDIEGNVQEIEIAGMLLAAAIVFISALVGGWVAGRMARFDGVMNGIGAALWLLLLVAVFAALGAWVGEEYNAFQRVGLPDWFAQLDVDELTTNVIIASIVGIVALIGGAALGGAIGEAYNRKVTAALTDDRTVARTDSPRADHLGHNDNAMTDTNEKGTLE